MNLRSHIMFRPRSANFELIVYRMGKIGNIQILTCCSKTIGVRDKRKLRPLHELNNAKLELPVMRLQRKRNTNQINKSIDYGQNSIFI